MDTKQINGFIILAVIVFFSWLIFFPSKDSTPNETFQLNKCTDYPEQSYYWKDNTMALKNAPHKQSWIKGQIPSCDNILIEILGQRIVDGDKWLNVKAHTSPPITGWQFETFLRK